MHPHSVRKFALGLEYEGAIHGQWPGVRIPIPEPQKTLYTNKNLYTLTKQLYTLTIPCKIFIQN